MDKLGEERYHHSPLDHADREIRLLKPLERPIGAEHDLLSFTVEHFDIDDCPEYNALSYAWGEPDEGYDISIDDQPFAVRKNLHDFLEASGRNQWFSQWIWIDAICIDQANVKEKSAQFQRMADIFYNAHEVMMWLGTGGEESDRAMEIVRAHCRQSLHHEHPDLEHLPQGQKPVSVDASKAITSDAYPSNRSLSISEIMGRAYWNRLWCAQEILVARRCSIYCANSYLEAEDALRIFVCRELILNSQHGLFLKYLMRGKAFIIACDHAEARSRRYTLPIEDCLFNLSKCGCTDDRDLVFGIMGVVEPNDRIAVDYGKSSELVFLQVLNKIRSKWRQHTASAMASTTKRRLISLGELMNLARRMHILHTTTGNALTLPEYVVHLVWRLEENRQAGMHAELRVGGELEEIVTSFERQARALEYVPLRTDDNTLDELRAAFRKLEQSERLVDRAVGPPP